MQKESKLLLLAGATLRCRRIEERLAALDSEMDAVRCTVSVDVAGMGQRDAYLRWSAGRRLALEADLAAAKAAMAAVHETAARAFGRAEVLGDLTDNARRAAQARRVRQG